MFLSIFIATIRPNNIIGFLDNLNETADDITQFEILIKLDEGDENLKKIISAYQLTSPLNIKYLSTEVLDGYYSLHDGYNKLLTIADPNTYFCWLLTDEIRFASKGWDACLKKYIKFFPDDIFRIKLSDFQLKNYYDFFECLPCPDNYAVTTRLWLEITGGWGNFWGPDSWHQCIDYFLGMSTNPSYPQGIWRSLHLYDINIKGQEAGQGIINQREIDNRNVKISVGWNYHSTHKAQKTFKRLAQRLNAHIYASCLNMKHYILEENEFTAITKLRTIDDKVIERFSYALPKLSVRLYYGEKRLPFKKIGMEVTKIFFPTLTFFYKVKNKIKRTVNYRKNLIVGYAVSAKKKFFSIRVIVWHLFLAAMKKFNFYNKRYYYNGKFLIPEVEENSKEKNHTIKDKSEKGRTI